MKFPYRLSAALVGTAATIALVQHQIVLAKTAIEVRSIAEAITVRIDGPGSERNNGSGVIIERQSNTYTIITAAHVVDAPGRYTISTSDGRRYTINSSQVRRLPGVDLATLQFTSNQNYSVARKGNSDQMRGGMTIYASGWYNPGPVVPERIFDTTIGRIVSHFQPKDGYALAYRLDVAQPGMSGGPVLDSEGRLIAINGRAERDLRTGNVDLVTGIPINTFDDLLLALPSNSKLCEIAKAITVQIIYLDLNISGNVGIGSGIIVQRKGTRYSVLTNAHVVGNSIERYGILTPDREVYNAYPLVIFKNYDLAVLQFDSQHDYQLATLAPISSVREEQKILLAGFPLDKNDAKANAKAICIEHLIYLGLFEQQRLGSQIRYQEYYDGNIKAGMSGGPLLNEQGEVVGIHSGRVGRGLDFNYFAIPIETFLLLAPSALDLRL